MRDMGEEVMVQKWVVFTSSDMDPTRFKRSTASERMRMTRSDDDILLGCDVVFLVLVVAIFELIATTTTTTTTTTIISNL